jgi:hypothetical protein
MAIHPLQRIFWLGALLCATTGALSAAEPARGRPIEYSGPRNERGSTNVTSLMPRRSTLLDQLESDINRPFKSIIPDSSLNGGIMLDSRPLPAPAPPSTHTRELINRKKDQMYLTPEDYAPKPLEDLYKAPELTPDGRDVKSLRPMEREIYRSFNPSRSAALTNQSPTMFGPGYGKTEGGLFSSPIGGSAPFGTTSPLDSALRKALGTEVDSSSSRVRDMRDTRELFGLGDSYKPNTKLTPSEMQHRDAFMQIYNPNYTPTASGAASSGGLFAPDSSFYDPPKPVVALPSPAVSSGYGSSPNAITPYTPSYTPPPPPPQPTPAPATVSPFMNMPRRNY